MPVEPKATNDLLRWYDQHARVLPWRIAPNSGLKPDPYRVWLAEIMLQQTNVAAAGPYFERFVARWPTVEALAAADDGALMAAWAGLGYYARARNLLAAARHVAALGSFPDTEAGLRTLPGVGDYTAAAVAAIAFGEAAIVIDANVERVASRWFAVSKPLPGARIILKARLAEFVPQTRPGDFAQAMMDLGATLCTPRAPRCDACPLLAHCSAYRMGTPTAFPVKPAKKARPTKLGIAWWIESDGLVACVRRPPKGMLGGMLALPGTGWTVEVPDASPPFGSVWRACPTPVSHSFTHFDLLLVVQMATVEVRAEDISGESLVWIARDQLETAGLPTLYKKAVAAVLASEALASEALA